MNITWDFQKIIREINEIKNWKTSGFEQKASKYFTLKKYSDMLFTSTINDRELPERSLIKLNTSLFYDYASSNKSLTYKLHKIFDIQALQMVDNFLKLTREYNLKDTVINLDLPLIDNYQYQLTDDLFVKFGDEFFNRIPFIEKNIVSKMIERNLIYLTKTSNTANPSPNGIYYTNRHILLTHNKCINLDSLFRVIHEVAHDKDFQKINSFYQKELHMANIFSEFYPKLVELLLMDFIVEKCDFLSLEVNLYKHSFLNHQNRYLINVLSNVTNPQKVLDNYELLCIDKPLFTNFEKSINEKQYYKQIEQFVGNKISHISKSNRVKDFINNPMYYILNIFDSSQREKSILLAGSILSDGKYLLSTLLAFKFYYLIKLDFEKGMDLLKEVTEELFNDYQNPEIVINKYHLEDYLSPDYIQNYTNEYNMGNKKLLKTLNNKN